MLYARQHPPRFPRLLSIWRWCEDARLWWFEFWLRRLAVGSPRWHMLQERLSRASSVGIEIRCRNRFYEKTLPRCGDQLYVLPGVIMNYPGNISIGRNVFLNRSAYIVAPVEVSIGSNVMVGPFTVINSGSHRYEDAELLIRDQGHKVAPIVIEDDVWIGAHAVILPGVTIGRGSVVGAGAVVTRSVAPFTVVVGVPARPMKERAGASAPSA